MSTQVVTWADVRCPWCWMGHRRLGAAVAATGAEVTVHRRSFLLEPDGPDVMGLTIREAALTSWGMSAEQWDATRDRIRMAAASDGLTIDMDQVRAVDSRPAHRLLKLGALAGVDPSRAWDRMFAAQLEQHLDLGVGAVLRELGSELEIEPAAVDRMLSTDRFADEVAADHQDAVARGIHGVPTVVAADRVLTGSHEVDELVAFLAAPQAAR